MLFRSLHTTRKYGGTGLGLSIAKQLVEAQWGHMEIKSELNAGTEFSFTLPFTKSKIEILTSVEAPINEFDVAELNKYKILLAEDSQVNVKLVLSLFSDYGIPVDVVENGKLAVEKIKNGHYDLVLMDMEMPEMNGYQATTIIRTELNNAVPIIAMTAHAMAGEKEKCLKLGMNDYISKPINSKLLFEKMYKNIHAGRNKKSETLDEKVINLEYLTDLLRGKSKDILETLDIFLTEYPNDLAVLDNAVNSSDYQTIMKKAHKMRPTANMLGIIRVEALLLKIEKLGMHAENIVKLKELNEKLQSVSLLAIAEVIVEKQKYIVEPAVEIV